MAKSLFDHLSQIYEGQRIDYFDTLEEPDAKSFNTYMIHRFVSMNPDYISAVNTIQQYWDQLSPREVYLFYSQLLPKKRQFNKYIKNSKDQEKYESWLVELVSTHYKVSCEEATDYLNIFFSSPERKDSLRTLVEGYGRTPKELKKVGL